MCEGVQHLVSSFMGGQPSFISLLSLLGVYFHFCKVHQEERIASYFLISGQQITLLLGQGSPWALWLLTFPSITPDSICFQDGRDSHHSSCFISKASKVSF